MTLTSSRLTTAEGVLERLVKALNTNAHPDGETDEVYPDWTEVQAAFEEVRALLTPETGQ